MRPTGDALERVGRAERWACAEGEVWRLPASDEATAARLVALGKKGVGGFAQSERDEAGVRLVRTVPARTLRDVGRGERLPWREALEVVRALARALDACERASLFPGPLRASAVVLAPGVWLRAES